MPTFDAAVPPARSGPLAQPWIRTERLLLRRWRESDRERFHALCSDPAVMRYFPAPLSRAESDELLDRCERLLSERRLGMWAVVELADDGGADGPAAGAVGLWTVDGRLPFAPAVELAWRMFPAFWGRGLAAEAARASAGYAFEELGLDELVAYTAAVNERSWRLMQRIGMRRDPAEDFAHPKLAPGSELAPHRLYRLAAPPRGL